MKHRTICKGLAVAIILLFIGVGIQPTIATVEPEQETTLDTDDCNLCPEIGEKYPELSDTFLNYKSIILKKDIKPICAILFLILLQYEIRWTILFEILSLFPILYILFYDLVYSYVILRFGYLFNYFYTIGWKKDCDWVTEPPSKLNEWI